MKKLIALICSILMAFNAPVIFAGEIETSPIVSDQEGGYEVLDLMPAATYISTLSAGICETDAGCLMGEVTGSFTGDGLHAIYQTNIQYLSSAGLWTNVDSGHPFRGYTPGAIDVFDLYYCYPTEGMQYRVHVYMRVVDSDGNLWDAAVINSPILIP